MAKKRTKGFERRKPELGTVAPPIQHFEQIDTTKERLEQLLAEILCYRLSDKCFHLFKRLAHINPAPRLAVNLRVIIQHLCAKDIENVLIDGLNGDERLVLLELDVSQVSSNAKQTAHSLLNMSTRLKMIRVFGKLFRTLRTCRYHVLEARLLDK